MSETNGQKLISSANLSQNAIDDLLSLGLGQPIQNTNNSQAPSTSAQAYNKNGSGNSSSALILDPWSIAEPPKNDNTKSPSGKQKNYF